MSTGLRGTLIRGAVWSVVLRWGIRFIGLISTLVIARILSPADYGLVAMAGLVTGLIETFLDADATTALLRSPNHDKSFADTAWTLRALQSLALAIAVAIAAPLAARYFGEPRLLAVLLVYSATIVCTGLSSVGPLLARRNLDFFMEVKLALFARIVGFVATVGLAFAWRNYWALVIGGVVGMLAGLAAGYAAHPYRPRPTLAHAREIFGFSQWMLLTGISLFFSRKIDGFVVGRVGTAADLGLYNVSLELGSMITTELGSPLSRALLPVLATLHDDPPRMQAAVMKTAAAVNTVTLPAGIGLAFVAPLAVPILLGSQWTTAAPLLVLFSLGGAIRFLVGPYHTIAMTLGDSRMLAITSGIEFLAFAAAIGLLYPQGIIGIAEARIASSVVLVLLWLWLGTRYGLTVAALVRSIWRPVTASGAMSLALWLVPTFDVPAVAQLTFRIAVGAVVYVASITALWIAAGRPDGIEQLALDRINGISRRAKRVLG